MLRGRGWCAARGPHPPPASRVPAAPLERPYHSARRRELNKPLDGRNRKSFRPGSGATLPELHLHQQSGPSEGGGNPAHGGRSLSSLPGHPATSKPPPRLPPASLPTSPHTSTPRPASPSPPPQAASAPRRRGSLPAPPQADFQPSRPTLPPSPHRTLLVPTLSALRPSPLRPSPQDPASLLSATGCPACTLISSTRRVRWLIRVPRSSFSRLPECARTSVTNEAIATKGQRSQSPSPGASAAAPVPPAALARGRPGNEVSRGPDRRAEGDGCTTTPSRHRDSPRLEFPRRLVVGKLGRRSFFRRCFRSLNFMTIFHWKK